jgi:hypothetical protein
MHISCIEINTICKWTKISFYFTHIALEFHRLCPKWFPCPCYIRRKPCTYLPLRLTLSPSRPKWVSTWSTSHSSTIGCVQNDFWSYGYIRYKLCFYLASRLTLSPNKMKWAFTWPTSPRSTFGCAQSNFTPYDFHARGTFSVNSTPILHRD